jgi:hypothetical protein
VPLGVFRQEVPKHQKQITLWLKQIENKPKTNLKASPPRFVHLIFGISRQGKFNNTKTNLLLPCFGRVFDLGSCDPPTPRGFAAFFGAT